MRRISLALLGAALLAGAPAVARCSDRATATAAFCHTLIPFPQQGAVA